MATIAEFTTKDESTIRDDILRSYRNGMIELTGVDPNVAPGSDMYIIASSIARALSVAQANAAIKADELMPDTATGTALERIGAVFGLSKRAASGATGNVTLESSGSTLVAVDTELVDAAGLRFKVSVGGTYANGALIPVQGVDTGKATNHAAAETLRWITAPPLSAQTAVVATGGLTGGAEAEDDETFRARLFAYLQNPPSGNNPEHVAELAEASSTLVQKAFVYPALQGPATVHVAVTGYPSEHVKARTVSTIIVNNTVAPYLAGLLGEHVYVAASTVAGYSSDVAIYLSLPSAATASPPGPGGGWLDGSPWPKAGNATAYAAVTAVTSTTRITVSCSTAPTAGVSRICWLRHDIDATDLDWVLYTATVTTVHSFGAGVADITIDRPFPGITTGVYIWPQCENQQAYVDALLEAYALMGPGEKSSNATVLARAFRHPPPQLSWPYSLGASQLRAITDAGDEVLDASYAYRSITTPPVDATTPNILAPHYVAFYPTP